MPTGCRDSGFPSLTTPSPPCLPSLSNQRQSRPEESVCPSSCTPPHRQDQPSCQWVNRSVSGKAPTAQSLKLRACPDPSNRKPQTRLHTHPFRTSSSFFPTPPPRLHSTLHCLLPQPGSPPSVTRMLSLFCCCSTERIKLQIQAAQAIAVRLCACAACMHMCTYMCVCVHAHVSI